MVKPLLLKYEGPAMHGKVVVHRCGGCGKESATYEGVDKPRGWERVDINRVACRRCSRGRR